jgi:LuxR family maltose regulon positive regulatory protein
MLFRADGLLPTRACQAVELAERHGWGEDPLAGIAYTVLGGVLLYQGRLADAEPWLERAERTLRTEAEPAAGMSLRFARGVLEMARGRYPQALSALEGAENLAGLLVRPHLMVASIRTRMVQALIRAGQAGRAAAILTGPDENERASAEARTAAAALQLAEDDPQAAADVLAPVLDGSVPGVRQVSVITALLLQAAARDALGDRAASGRALERALDIAESTGILLPFLLDPLPTQLERHRTAYPVLLARIRELFAHPLVPSGGPGGVWGERFPPKSRGGLGGIVPPGLAEPLTDSEARILRYLPTHLTAQEIARELSLSVHTVTTHMRHLYAKLGVHRRRQAVEHARALDLLAPAPWGSSDTRAGRESQELCDARLQGQAPGS